MFELVNRTPFAVALSPFTDKHGVDHAGVVIKGTWSLGGAGAPTLAEEQRPIARADVRHGDAPDASLRYAADLGMAKPATDVALVGHARASHGRATELDVALRVGPVRKVLRVFGDRIWYRSATSWAFTSPRPFEAMPLVYERAFGGRDTTPRDPKQHGSELRNPVGTGFAVPGSERLEGLPLPNIEAPEQLIRASTDRPPPAGFGLIDASWAPRSGWAGTYDAAWKEHRAPLLPGDFDERFFNAAHPDLVIPGRLRPGEAIAATNVGTAGLRTTVPNAQLTVVAVIKGRATSAEPQLDTVWLDADNLEMVTVWRAVFPCPRSLLRIDAVFVKRTA